MADIKIGTSAINKFYMGSTAVDKLYLGTTEIWAAVVPDIELNWIENTNRAATFTTALTSDNTSYLELKIQFKEALQKELPVVGAKGYGWRADISASITNGIIGIFTYSYDLYGLCAARAAAGYSSNGYRQVNRYHDDQYYSTNINTTNPYVITFNNNPATSNGNSMYLQNSSSADNAYKLYTDSSHSTLAPWVIFNNDTGTPRIKFYYIKTWNNSSHSTLQHHYVPVRHWDGSKYVVCIKDKVTNTYIYQSGSGTLTYG